MQASLRRNLMRAFATPVLVSLFAGGWLAYRVAEDVVSAAYDQSLLNLANGLANRVRNEYGVITIALPKEAEDVLRTDTVDRIYFRVRDDMGHIVAGDSDLPPLESSDRDLRPHFYEAIYRGEAIRGVRLHPEQGNASFYVTVAETLGKRQKAIQDLLIGFGLAVSLVLVAVGGAVRFGIPSGLAPLRRLEQELTNRSGQDLTPVDLSGAPLEIRAVVLALNVLLGRLREANSAQREFLQDAAHQLRTPLASLQVQIELLQAEAGRSPALERLRQSVTRVTRLANQLLALARAEAGGRLMADASDVDLAELVDDMLEDWLRLADQKHIDFGVQRGAAHVIGDPTLLRELIANLVDNALKYTQSGGQVTLRCMTCGTTLEIDVSDNGPGIPEGQRESVFERFRRLPGSSASGSGLGLPISREIVACHGGTIDVASGTNGSGTCIRVRMPAAPMKTRDAALSGTRRAQ